MPRSVLVVDDDVRTLNLIRLILEHNGYVVFTAMAFHDAVNVLEKTHPDCALLDVMLPDKSGLNLLQYIRTQSTNTHLPVLMLTSKTEEVDTILGLEMGADDYIKKPFNKRELIARIEAIFRRIDMDKSHSGKTIRIGELLLDTLRNTLNSGNEVIELSPLEYQLLVTMASNPGKIYTREELMDRLWSEDVSYDSRTVDVHVRRLRKKLENFPEALQSIETVRGYGYRFNKSKT